MFNHIKLTKAQLLALRDFGTEHQDRLLVARFLANIFNTNVLRKHGYENGKNVPTEYYELQQNADGVNVFFDYGNDGKVSFIEVLLKTRNGSGFYTIFDERYTYIQNKWIIENTKTTRTIVKTPKHPNGQRLATDNQVINSEKDPNEDYDYKDSIVKANKRNGKFKEQNNILTERTEDDYYDDEDNYE